MKTDSAIIKNLARTADIVNTINGGTVFPTFNTTKEEDHYRLEVSAPTVNPENIKVEVSQSDLLVYQNVSFNSISLPNLLGMVKISADVSVDEITAEYDDDLLVVIMPFSEMPGGFDREIKIHRPN